MRDKAGAEGEGGGGIKLTADASALGEAKSALAALGYKPVEIQRFTEAVYKDGMTTEQIIQEALKRAVK
jgi:Holliday junction DNA helicase RuvA